MNAMNLTERYLRAVAAQLPADKREDIIAELRDLLMTRMEAREAELGRPLNEAEEEAVLRDFGHPLAVASRYGETQGLVGPELYPWWLFGVKAGLAVLAAITLVGVVVRSIVGDVTVGQAITQGLHGLITGAVTIVGLLTIAGFFIIAALDALRVPGAILIGILAVTAASTSASGVPAPTTSVSAPGQKASARSCAASSSTAMRSAAPRSGRCTISGLKLGRPLAS